MLLRLVLLFLAPEAPAAPPAPPEPPPAVRVVAAVAEAAKANAARPDKERREGDALADLYVRAAAGAADGDAGAFLVGLAHTLDPSAALARYPFTAVRFVGLETEEAAKARRATMGKPTMRGRGDLLLHFLVAAALADIAGETHAETAAVAKELADAPGPTGFSFSDVLADFAGIRFARHVRGLDRERLSRLATEFRGADFLPDPAGRLDGLTPTEFAERFGSASDERFRKEIASIREAVAALPAYAPAKR